MQRDLTISALCFRVGFVKMLGFSALTEKMTSELSRIFVHGTILGYELIALGSKSMSFMA